MDIDSDSNISECVICLEDLNSNIQLLPCQHVIHKKCFDEYLIYNTMHDIEENISFTECPICKAQIQIKQNADGIQFCLYVGSSLFVLSCTFIISKLLMILFKTL